MRIRAECKSGDSGDRRHDCILMILCRDQVCDPVRYGCRGLELAAPVDCGTGHPSETAASRARRSSARHRCGFSELMPVFDGSGEPARMISSCWSSLDVISGTFIFYAVDLIITTTIIPISIASGMTIGGTNQRLMIGPLADRC